MECPSHIDKACILPAGSKRVSRQPQKYVDEDYMKLMLADVHEDELHAALEDEAFDDDSEEDEDASTVADSDDEGFVEEDDSESASEYEQSESEESEEDESEEEDDEDPDELIVKKPRHQTTERAPE